MSGMRRSLSKWRAGVVPILFSLLLILPGCGGGGDDNNSSPPPPASVSVTSGTITQKGSVFVNGVEFGTEGATLVMDGETTTLGADDGVLKIGMQAAIEGQFNGDGLTGQAKRIKVKNMMIGPIDAVVTGSLTKTLSILGQTVVVVEGETRLDGISFAGLAVGPVVKVHGLAKPDGSVEASYIELMADSLTDFLADPNHYLEVKGPVSNLAGATFTINALTVDASGVNPLPTGLADGVLVEVKGRVYAPDPSPTLTATSVTVLSSSLGVTDADLAVIEGYITSLDTAQQTFVVEGQTVSYAGVSFLGGDATDLAVAAKVEAEGTLVDGILQAVKIRFKDGIRIEGKIASAGDTIALQGLPEIAPQIELGLTWFQHFENVGDLPPDEGVKVRARMNGSTLMATRIDLEPNGNSDQVKLRGPVGDSDGTAGTVTVLDYVVDTSSIPDANFKIGETSVGSAAFFAALKAGDMVKINGQLNTDGTAVTWREIEIDE